MRAGVISKEIGPQTLVSKFVPYEVDVSPLTPEPIPSEGEPRSPVAKLMLIVSEESAAPIVEELLSYENMAPKLEVTPPTTELDVPIVEESLRPLPKRV